MSERGKVVFHADHATASVGGMDIVVRGNDIQFSLCNPDDPSEVHTRERTVRSYGEPVYDSLESFLRRAGDEARVGMIIYKDAGVVVCFYDGGPHRVMTAKEAERLGIPDEDRDGYSDGGCFGFIVNLQYPHFDELGTAPFPLNTETIAAYNARMEEQQRAMMEIFGNATIININPNEEVLGVDYDRTGR
jgi:hypothetical protein